MLEFLNGIEVNPGMPARRWFFGEAPHPLMAAEKRGRADALAPMILPDKSDETALVRHAAVCWIQEALKENFTLTRALALASERQWGGKFYGTSTLEGWYYAFKQEGFSALQRQPRKDKGTRKALSPEACEALLQLRRQYPQLKVRLLVRQLLEKGTLQAGTFSLPSVYRLFAEAGLDAHSIQTQFPVTAGPTKAFECALANELWMTDMMFGPTLKLPTGQVIQTRLFCLLDDCSRLVPHAQYYDSEKLGNFLDCFRQALAHRGFPEKLHTDRDYDRPDKSAWPGSNWIGSGRCSCSINVEWIIMLS